MSRTTKRQSPGTEVMIERADRIHPPRATALYGFARKLQQGTVQSRPPQTLPPVMLMSIWFALVTGLLELGLVYARNHVVGWSTLSALQVSRHFPWMIPAANLVLFFAWGLIVVVVGRFWRGIGGRPSVFLLSFPACLAPLLVIPGLYPITYIVVAAGVAASVVRLISAGPGRFCRLVTTSLPVLFVVTCLFAG